MANFEQSIFNWKQEEKELRKDENIKEWDRETDGGRERERQRERKEEVKNKPKRKVRFL